MLAKCANPNCSAPFRYLREGKLFQVERDEGNTPILRGPRARPRADRRVEYFWLCGMCAARVTLAFDRVRGMITVPLASEPLVAPNENVVRGLKGS
jgi:hypothetical protein